MAATKAHLGARVEPGALHAADGGHRGGAAAEPGHELVDLVEGEGAVRVRRGKAGPGILHEGIAERREEEDIVRSTVSGCGSPFNRRTERLPTWTGTVCWTARGRARCPKRLGSSRIPAYFIAENVEMP